ncbi:MAG: sensor histidine kinase [Lachnospiraceae bacterium]|nr:sensor histidine kinase [Lachnospiraceae bacterium]
MKESRTLRQSLIGLAVVFLVVPLMLLSALTQVRIWKLLYQNMENDMREELVSTNQLFDMVMDKYGTVLYDFCTDDDMIDLVELINEKEDVLEVNSNRLRRELSHICNRNEGIEGITLVTREGKIFFYDRNAASFVITTWADSVSVPKVKQGVVYQDGSAVNSGDDRMHLIQIARRFVDYQNIRKEIGTVIISINKKTLWNVIQTKADSVFYLCDGDVIVAAKDDSVIGKHISEMDARGRKTLALQNVMTGWTLYNYYSMREYNQAMTSRMTLELFSTVGSLLFVIVLLIMVTGPSLRQVNQLVGAMEQVQRGDFSVKVDYMPYLPREIVQIVDGFNTMVQKIGLLMDQLRQSLVEQKNAELSAMEAQIDPHFLYNTLDTINWKAIEQEEYEISGMVGALADILRYSIRNPGETVSVGQELYWLSQYVMLQKEKLEQPLEMLTDVPEEIKKYRLHKLLLQPFIENAIKHAFYRKTEACRLEIGMRLIEKQIHIIIRDNGKGIPEDVLRQLNDSKREMKGHVGLANVRKRLKLYYGDEAAVYYESRVGAGTTVHLFVKAICGEDEKDENRNS